MSVKTNRKTVKRPSRKTKAENVKLPNALGKIVDVVTAPFKKKLPFGGKGGRKRKIDSDTQEKLDSLREQEREYQIERAKDESAQSLPFNDFFYTRDKFLDQFEDSEIYAVIKEKYPNFMLASIGDSAIRRSVVTFLEDEDFVLKVMRMYGMTVIDLFKFILRIDTTVFKKQFVVKIQKLIKTKKYYYFTV